MAGNEVAALRALTNGDVAGARTALDGGVTRPLLNAALRTHLAATGNDTADGHVYDQPAAFTAFIRGGGNVGLYEAVSSALAEQYDRHDVASLVDIGCGDGRAVVPAAEGRDVAVTLVEPSRALLDDAVAQLAGATAHNTDAASFVSAMAGRFDLAESTFALHALPSDERSRVLTALRGHVSRLAIAEFDVPDHPVGSTAHLTFLADTYEQGLAEYGTDRDLVAQGFLMPVLTGQLTPGATRNTWEQPATAWAAQLTACGYTEVMIEPLYDYWSSPAFLLTAKGDA
jgi:hypothetical protein